MIKVLRNPFEVILEFLLFFFTHREVTRIVHTNKIRKVAR